MRLRFAFLLIPLISLSFFSCSESDVDVVAVSATTIFDYKDADSAPEARLAVFLQATNEIQRTESFTVTSDSNGYVWSVKNPGIFTGLNKSFAYSVNLTVPEGEQIPKGSYSVIYYDAAGNKDEVKFSVDYKEQLFSSNSKNFKELLSNATENLAVYDENSELLFMGRAKASWKTNEAILKDYKLAVTKRLCYVTPGNTIICMMPPEKLKNEQ